MARKVENDIAEAGAQTRVMPVTCVDINRGSPTQPVDLAVRVAAGVVIPCWLGVSPGVLCALRRLPGMWLAGSGAGGLGMALRPAGCGAGWPDGGDGEGFEFADQLAEPPVGIDEGP